MTQSRANPATVHLTPVVAVRPRDDAEPPDRRSGQSPLPRHEPPGRAESEPQASLAQAIADELLQSVAVDASQATPTELMQAAREQHPGHLEAEDDRASSRSR